MDKKAEGHIEQVLETGSSLDTHNEKVQVDIEHAQQLAAAYMPGSPEEKALVRKLDWRLVVCISCLLATRGTDTSQSLRAGRCTC